MIKRIVLVICVCVVFLVACVPAVPTTATEPNSMAPDNSGVLITVKKEGAETRVIGEPFEIPMDNRGGGTEVKHKQEKSRSFSAELNIEVSEKVAAEIGGSVEVATARLGAEIETRLGIRFGSESTSTSSIEVSVPAGKCVITTLQWKEVWAKGTVALVRPDGSYIDVLPFSALNDVVLMQEGTKDCESNLPINPEVVSPTISTPGLPVIEPTPTPAPIGRIVVPGNSSEGFKFTCTQPGLYIFKYVSGAYSTYAEPMIPAGESTWLTALRVFQNRGAEWNGVAISDSPDYRFADTPYHLTSSDAEQAAQNAMLAISLLKGDYLTFVPADGKPYYSDNAGEVVIDVLYMPR